MIVVAGLLVCSRKAPKFLDLLEDPRIGQDLPALSQSPDGQHFTVPH